MIRALIFLAVAVPIVLGAAWLADHPGRLRLDVVGWRVEMSALVALCLFALALALAGFLAAAIKALAGVPSHVSAGRQLRRQHSGLNALTGALTALAGNQWPQASRQLESAGKHLGHAHPAVLLLGAQLARAQGQRLQMQSHLAAMLKAPETEWLARRTMAEAALQEGRREEAVEQAGKAIAASPSDRLLNLTLFDDALRRRDFKRAQSQLTAAMRHGAFAADEAKRYQAAVHLLTAQQGSDVQAALSLARKAHHIAPEWQPAILAHLEALHHAGQSWRWRRATQKAWCAMPDEALAAHVLGATAELSPKQKSKLIARIASVQPDHPESLLLRAQDALRNQSYDDARHYLREALARQESARVYRLFIEVEKAAPGASSDAIRQWELQAAAAPQSTEGWQCGLCHHHQPRWSAYCGRCDAFDSLTRKAAEVMAP